MPLDQLPPLSGNTNQRIDKVADKTRQLVTAVNAAEAADLLLARLLDETIARVAKLEQAPAPGPEPEPEKRVAFVVVTLADPSIEVGETTTVTAEAKAEDGTVIAGLPITVSVLDPAVASLSGLTVTALADGITRIVAAVDDHGDTVVGFAELDVSPLPEPQPEPEPEPQPEPPPADLMTRLLGGPLPSVHEVMAAGGTLKTYEEKAQKALDEQFAKYGPGWETINYYDRAAIEYARWARTGNATHRDRARLIAVNYRDGFYHPEKTDGFAYNTSTFWSMPLGVALHHLDTGDEASRRAVGYSAEWLNSVNWFNSTARTKQFPRPSSYTQSPAAATIPDPMTVGVSENRNRARILEAFVLAHAISAPTGGPGSRMVPQMPGTWAERATAILGEILKVQQADGSYRDESSGGAEKPFMSGLLNDALALYYAFVAPDPRILSAVRRNLDYNWANCWLGTSFAYYEWNYTDPNNSSWAGSRSPSPDLSNMMTAGYGWLARVTGDPTHRSRARAAFDSGVTLGNWVLTKHTNQQLASSTRALDVLLG